MEESKSAQPAAAPPPQAPHLALLDPAVPHDFISPAKRINEGEDVEFFLTSRAYGDILAWILQLNAAMFPRKTGKSPGVQAWEKGSDAVEVHPAARSLATLLTRLDEAIAEAPPDTGPRRFGNVSFRKWYAIVEERADSLLDECLGPSDTPLLRGDARKELRAYLLGSFGSAQRLDYGTGHELSFLAFLGGLWKLGLFGPAAGHHGDDERSIVLHAMIPYLDLVRKLILTYNLEPAGTHGVWGLDDHSFVPYIFGSAQLSPAIADASSIPQEGSLPGAPDPGDVSKSLSVERLRRHNMYFDAIGFIYDVKKGPFWEHSPMLFDISGVQTGWAKINKGMIKMYIAEVLSKFPVVQHFHFGHLFQWQRDPDAILPASFTQRQAQAQTKASTSMASPTTKTTPPVVPTTAGGMPATAAPWAKPRGATTETQQTAAPWARGSGAGIAMPRRGLDSRPSATSHPHPGSTPAVSDIQTQVPGSVMTRAAGGQDVPVTRAPWAKR